LFLEAEGDPQSSVNGAFATLLGGPFQEVATRNVVPFFVKKEIETGLLELELPPASFCLFPLVPRIRDLYWSFFFCFINVFFFSPPPHPLLFFSSNNR